MRRLALVFLVSLLVAACSGGSSAVSPIEPTIEPTAFSPIQMTARPAPKTAKPATAVYYKNCAAVRSAGKAPLHRSDPGYRSGLDRDSDGLACE